MQTDGFDAENIRSAFGADQGVVGDYVGHHTLSLHCLQLLGADQGTLGLTLFGGLGAPLKILEARAGPSRAIPGIPCLFKSIIIRRQGVG